MSQTPRVTVSLKLQLPVYDKDSHLQLEHLLQGINDQVTQLDGAVVQQWQVFEVPELEEFGIPREAVKKLGAACILDLPTLLKHSEDELIEWYDDVDYALTFVVRKALHRKNCYLKDDSREKYRLGIIAYLEEQHYSLYARLRMMDIVSLARLLEFAQFKKPPKSVRQAMQFIKFYY